MENTKKEFAKRQSNKSLIQKINNKKISAGELKRIVKDLQKHLDLPHGTLHNYPKRKIIDAVCENYLRFLSADELEEYTQKKINFFMEKFYILASTNQKINVYPQFIKIMIAYLKGLEDSEDLSSQQFTVNNFFPLSEKGKISLPEPKTADVYDVSSLS
jgi:hypothetical protein